MIFSKEFKSTFGKMIAWLLVIGVLTGLLMAFYPLMLEDRMKSIFDTFINGLSDNLAAGLGFDKEVDYSNISSYLAFVFQYSSTYWNICISIRREKSSKRRRKRINPIFIL